MIYKGKFIDNLMILAIVICNLSQIPALFGNSIIRMGYTTIWILLFGLLIVENEFKINIRHLYIPILFDFVCLIGFVFSKNYMSSALFRPVNMSAFIMAVGILLGTFSEERTLRKISIAYIISSIIVGGVIYFTVFRGANWSGSNVYLYTSKNSAAQFLLVGMILVFILFYKNNKALSVLLIGFYVSLILMMKSRTTIVAMVVFLLYFVFFVVESKLERNIYLIIISIFVLLVIFHPDIHRLIITEIFLNNRTTDISTLSSGRDNHWRRFNEEFNNFLFFGTGGTYLESMPLAALMSYGILGGVPILAFSIKPLIYSFRCRKDQQKKMYTILVFSISVIMLVNSIFEEQAPFGPGVKCYFLWLVFGMLIGKGESNSESDYYEEYTDC